MHGKINGLVGVTHDITDQKNREAELLKAIREEYDHNVAQQIYISSEAWGLIAEAKEELIKLANMIGNALPQDSPAAQFSKFYLDAVANAGKPLPNETALSFLKQEIAQIL